MHFFQFQVAQIPGFYQEVFSCAPRKVSYFSGPKGHRSLLDQLKRDVYYKDTLTQIQEVRLKSFTMYFVLYSLFEQIYQ